jgi:hypothetical protein
MQDVYYKKYVRLLIPYLKPELDCDSLELPHRQLVEETLQLLMGSLLDHLAVVGNFTNIPCFQGFMRIDEIIGMHPMNYLYNRGVEFRLHPH